MTDDIRLAKLESWVVSPKKLKDFWWTKSFLEKEKEKKKAQKTNVYRD